MESKIQMAFMRIKRKRLKSEITCYCHFLIFVVRHNGRSVFQLRPKVFRQFVASVRRNRFRTYYIRIDNFRRPNSVIFCFTDLKPRWCPTRSKNVRFISCDKNTSSILTFGLLVLRNLYVGPSIGLSCRCKLRTCSYYDQRK